MSDDIKAVETSAAESEGFSIEMGEDTSVETTDNEGVEFDTDDLQEEDAGGEAEGDGEEGEAEGDEEDLPDLGEFDPENAEAWDERYYPQGQMNKDLLSKEFFTNAAKGEAGLNAATYDYLESKGISKGVAKEVEAALMTQREAEKAQVGKADVELMEIAGGPDVLGAALSWGKAGGYSKEEQKAFNAATKSKDPHVRRQAVESLMFRYGRANPDAGEKPALPKRDATKGKPGGGGQPAAAVKPFATRDEYRRAKAEAGDNQARLREVTRRLNVSNL